MIKIFLIFSLLFLWALQFFKPAITRKHKRHYIFEQISLVLLFSVLILLVIFGV